MLIGNVTRDNLIAGDYPLKAVEIIINGPTTGKTEFKRGDVIAQLSEGSYALVDTATAETDGDNAAGVPIGIITDNVTINADEQLTTMMYVKGEFNLRSLNFGGTDTISTHSRRMIEIGLIPREPRQ